MNKGWWTTMNDKTPNYMQKVSSKYMHIYTVKEHKIHIFIEQIYMILYKEKESNLKAFLFGKFTYNIIQ